jgi:DNA-binding winged helix-turn-helix (wHTH) protein
MGATRPRRLMRELCCALESREEASARLTLEGSEATMGACLAFATNELPERLEESERPDFRAISSANSFAPSGTAIGQENRVFVFGPFRFAPGRQQLLREWAPIRIGSRAIDILTALVERPGETLSKEELIARAWPSTFVEEGNLKVHIAALRKALGDAHTEPKYIVTANGCGYRFAAPVKIDGADGVAPEGRDARSSEAPDNLIVIAIEKNQPSWAWLFT